MRMIGDLIDDDEWIAVNSLNNSNQTKESLLFIVSINDDEQKIIIVSREHHRIHTDDENTKHWYDLYSCEKFYLIHQQIVNFDTKLEQIYPTFLRPVNGYLYKYFNKLTSNDEKLINAIENYLKQVFNSLGKRIFLDVFFNSISSEDYFQIYSEFNLKALNSTIVESKSRLYKVLNSNDNSKNSTANLKLLINSYSDLEKDIDAYLGLLAEYYHILLKPLIDNRELVTVNIFRLKKLLENDSHGEKSKETYRGTIKKQEKEVAEITMNIDALYVEYKSTCVQINEKFLGKIRNDRTHFPEATFDALTNNRIQKMEKHLSSKKIELYNLQLSLLLREKQQISENNEKDLNKFDLKIKKLRVNLMNEEEALLKKDLQELRIKYNISTPLTNERRRSSRYSSSNNDEASFGEDIQKNEDEIDDSEKKEDDDEFYDALEDPSNILLQEAEEKRRIILEYKEKEAKLQVKLRNLGTKKSALRNTINKLTLEQKVSTDDLKKDDNKERQNNDKFMDDTKREFILNERKKAVQRLKDYKLKHGSTSASPIPEEPEIKKPEKKAYIPKSKQTILAPCFQSKKTDKPKETEAKTEKSITSISEEIPKTMKVQETKIEETKEPLQNTISSQPIPPPPPPPPPLLPALFTASATVSATAPILVASNVPPPPPPPPQLVASISLFEPHSIITSMHKERTDSKWLNPLDELKEKFRKGIKLKNTADMKHEKIVQSSMFLDMQKELDRRREFFDNSSASENSDFE